MNSKYIMMVVIYMIALYSLEAIYIASSSNTNIETSKIEGFVSEAEGYKTPEKQGFWSRITESISELTSSLKFIANFLTFNVSLPDMNFKMDYIFRCIFVYPVWIFGVIQIINVVRGVE